MSLISKQIDELRAYAKIDYIVDILDQIKESNPNQTIIIETPGKSVSCKLKDTLICISQNNNIVIDVK